MTSLTAGRASVVAAVKIETYTYTFFRTTAA
jgi:hypothetical protein